MSVIEPHVSAEVLERALNEQKGKEGNMVRLIALTMRDSSKMQVPKGIGFEFVDVPALGLSPPIPQDHAETITKARRMNSSSVKPAVVWQPMPPSRPKGAKPTSFDRILEGGGKVTFNSDVYAPPAELTMNGRIIHHSVSQAQHFISHCLNTQAGVERFITDFDRRAPVAAWGNYVISMIQQKERVNMGLAGRPVAVS